MKTDKTTEEIMKHPPCCPRHSTSSRAPLTFSSDMLKSGQMETIIQDFIKAIADGQVEIYNEFSLQHELGIYLRQVYGPPHKVQFERNVSYFFSMTRLYGFVKKEIDVVVFVGAPSDPLLAIELKFPRNGQYPEQMFSFCKDIQFIEQLKLAGFPETYLLIFADDPLFYSGSAADGIYPRNVS